jgi:hypothetical protein
MPDELIIKTELAQALWQYGEGRAAVAFLTDVPRMDGGNSAALKARDEILAYPSVTRAGRCSTSTG